MFPHELIKIEHKPPKGWNVGDRWTAVCACGWKSMELRHDTDACIVHQSHVISARLEAVLNMLVRG